MSAEVNSAQSTRNLAAALRKQASDLRFRIGRYHDESGVDRQYGRSAALLDEAAEALDGRVTESVLRKRIADELQASADREGDWYGGTTASAIRVVLHGPREALT